MYGIQRLDTLVKTAITDVARFAERRARGPVWSPLAYDVSEKAMNESLTALYAAASAPLTGPMFWREAPLPAGRTAQVFNSANGTTCTIRKADGSTEYSFTYRDDRTALADFATLVTTEAKHGRR